MTTTSTPTPPAFRIPAPQGPVRQGPLSQGPVSSVAVRRRPTRATFIRRRIVAAVGALFVALALVLGTSAMTAEAGDGLPTVSDGSVVVQPGQTLWDIAGAHAPEGSDVRSYVLKLEQLNGVRADQIAAWDVLLLPAR